MRLFVSFKGLHWFYWSCFWDSFAGLLKQILIIAFVYFVSSQSPEVTESPRRVNHIKSSFESRRPHSLVSPRAPPAPPAPPAPISQVTNVGPDQLNSSGESMFWNLFIHICSNLEICFLDKKFKNDVIHAGHSLELYIPLCSVQQRWMLRHNLNFFARMGYFKLILNWCTQARNNRKEQEKRYVWNLHTFIF